MVSLRFTFGFAQFCHVPDLHSLIPAAGVQTLAIGPERHAGDEACVTTERMDQGASVTVPDFHSAILTTRGDPPALLIGAERQRVDLATVFSLEGFKLIAGLDVPDDDRVLLTPRGQPPAIRAEGHIHARPGNPRLESTAGFLRVAQALSVPQFDLPVATHRNKVFAAAAEDQRTDFPVVLIKCADLLTGPGIPDLHSPLQLSCDQISTVGAESHGLERPSG